MGLIRDRLEQGIFILLVELIADKVDHEEADVVCVSQKFADLRYLLYDLGVAYFGAGPGDPSDDVLLELDQLPQIQLVEVCHALIDEFKVYLVPLHHLLVLGVRSDYLGELVNAQFFGTPRAPHHAFVLSKHPSYFFIELLIHLRNVLVSESYPQVILVVQDYGFWLGP